MTDVIRVSICREDRPAGTAPRDQVYEIEADGNMTVLEVLQEIYCFLDPTLAFRSYRCGRRICRSCEVKLDGKIVRGCAALLHPGKTYRLAAAHPEALIRDLVFYFDLPSSRQEKE